MAEHEDDARPDVADPLSEPTIGRRIWAAYLQRGYTRKSFAAAMDTTYGLVHGWDHGKPGRSISLAKLQLASRLLGYSMDALCFGKQALVGDGEPVLDDAGIREALREVAADIPARAAFAEHMRNDGAFQEVTRTYVHIWVSIYRQQRKQGATVDQANAAALMEAINGQATAAAVASSQPELRDLTPSGLKTPAQRAEIGQAMRQVLPAVTKKAHPSSSRRSR